MREVVLKKAVWDIQYVIKTHGISTIHEFGLVLSVSASPLHLAVIKGTITFGLPLLKQRHKIDRVSACACMQKASK